MTIQTAAVVSVEEQEGDCIVIYVNGVGVSHIHYTGVAYSSARNVARQTKRMIVAALRAAQVPVTILGESNILV